jgi:hypothetical protein
MATGFGKDSYWQLGREAVFGTAVARTHKLEMVSEDLHFVQGVLRDPSLYNQRSRRSLDQGGVTVQGKIKTRGNYESLGMPLDWLFGTATYGSAGGADAGPTNSVYTHTYTEKSNLNSYTLDVVKGNIPASKSFLVTGAVCKGCTIRTQAVGSGESGYVMFDWDVIAKDMQSNQTPTAALTSATVTPLTFVQSVNASLKDGTSDTSTGLRVRELEIQIINHVAEDRFYLGSPNIDQPLPNDFWEVKWNWTQEFQTQSQYDNCRSFTDSTLQVLFNDSHAGTPRGLQFTTTAGKPIDYTNPVERYGIMVAKAGFEGYYSATDTGAVKCILSNLLATVSTANP